MPSVPFSIVDVFSTTPYKGNPLAVVDARDQDLTDTQLKLITRQFNLSETTFFFRSTKATYKLRSFLPDGKEVFGAGHNILGVWWHLAHAGLLDFSTPQHRTVSTDSITEQFTFHHEIGDEISPVTITKTTSPTTSNPTPTFHITLRQSPPKSHATHPSPSTLAAALGLSPTDIGFPPSSPHHSLPAQVLSTSTTHHLLVPLTSLDALHRAELTDRAKLVAQLKLVDERAYGIYLFTPTGDGEYTNYQARFFSPGMAGEDPATGSAAGPLGAYLYWRGVVKVDGESGKVGVRVVQGLEVGRECVIEVGVSVEKGDGPDGREERVEVDIIGGGVRVGGGEIEVPGLETVF